MAAITPERVAAMQRLCEAATKGPWRASGSDIDQMTDAGKGYPLDVYPDSAEIVASHWSDDGSTGVVREADAAFIAESRTFVPDLLEAYAELLAEYRGYQEAVRHELTCGDDGFSHYCGNCGRTIDRNDKLRALPSPPVQEER